MANDVTKVMFVIDELNNTLFFDCMNHCKDYTVCAIVSTLANVLAEAAYRAGIEPTEYSPGHVRIDISEGNATLFEIFHIVEKGLNQVAKQHPDQIKIY